MLGQKHMGQVWAKRYDQPPIVSITARWACGYSLGQRSVEPIRGNMLIDRS